MAEGSFTSRNVVDGDWKFRNLEQKFRNLYLKLQKYINIFDIFVEYFRIFASLHRVHYSWLDRKNSRSSITGLELVLFATVVSQSIMHMHVPYNTACFVLLIHNACSCRGGSCEPGNCLVELIIPAYSVLLIYTQGQLMQPCRCRARCNFQLQNIYQQSSLNLALHLIRH